MLHHISIGVADIERAAKFYDAALRPLGYVRVWSDLRPGQTDQEVGYGPAGSGDKLALKQVPRGLIRSFPGSHIALAAASRDAVAAFHAAALAAGGEDNGGPGLRPHYGPHYYAAFVVDPERNRLEAVCDFSTEERVGLDSMSGGMTTHRSVGALVEAPRLETERLLLTAHVVDDFSSLATRWADPEVTKYIGKPSTPKESWKRLLMYRGLWPLLGYGIWAVREKHSGLYVGDVGFADLHRELEPSIDGIPEAGWVLSTWAQGKGYANEALNAALGWLEREVKCDRAVCMIARENLPSRRVAEKAGFCEPLVIQYEGAEGLLYTRLCKK